MVYNCHIQCYVHTNDSKNVSFVWLQWKLYQMINTPKYQNHKIPDVDACSEEKTHRHFHNLNYFRAWWHTCLLLHLIVFVCRTCIHQYKGKTEIYRHLQLFWCIIATHRWLNLTLAFYHYNTCYFLLRGCHYLKQENLFQRLWLYLD